MAIALPIAFSLLAACQGGNGDKVSVDKAWVRLAAVPGRPAAAYVTIHGGKDATRLIAIDSAQAGSSELHQSVKSGGPAMKSMGGMMAMRRVDGLDVPAGATVDFSGAGYHAMLFGVGTQVKAGATMPLTIRFAKGDPIAVDARVIGAGDSPPY
jgi:copper(I)-binding protein